MDLKNQKEVRSKKKLKFGLMIEVWSRKKLLFDIILEVEKVNKIYEVGKSRSWSVTRSLKLEKVGRTTNTFIQWLQ